MYLQRRDRTGKSRSLRGWRTHLFERRTTIIIPNYNGARHLPRLWQSLSAQTRPPARTLLVDNGSTDNSTEHLPDFVELLALPHNYGFAAAVNRGIEATRTEYVAILNNDVVLDADWLAYLEDSLSGTPHQFATPLLLSADNPERIDGAFDLFTRSGCAERMLHGSTISHPFASEQQDIQFPPMTAALFRRQAFDAVGLLNESFGSYYEDVEWGLRASAAGQGGCFVPTARALHAGSATYGAWSSRSTYLISRNQLLLVAGNYPRNLIREWWWPIVCGNALFLLLAARRGKAFAALRGKAAALLQWRTIRRRNFPPQETGASRQAPQHLPTRNVAKLRDAILESEHAWRNLSGNEGTSLFWKLYFQLCPIPESTPARHSPIS